MGQLTAGAADQPCFFMFFSGGSGGFTMDLPWIYHDLHGEINGTLMVNQPSSDWDLPLMFHAYVFDIEIVQPKQRKCASTRWSSFFWMNPAFTYAGIMLSMNCFFSL